MSRKVFIGQKVKSLINTGGLAVGETVVSLSADTRDLEGGVQIVAQSTNTGVVYVGLRPTLTAGTAASTDGFPLAAGETLFVPAAKESDLKFIASAAAQKIYFVSY